VEIVLHFFAGVDTCNTSFKYQAPFLIFFSSKRLDMFPSFGSVHIVFSLGYHLDLFLLNKLQYQLFMVDSAASSFIAA
jgi:hypothetical protein